MKGRYGSIKNIYNGNLEEELAGACYVTVFKIHLPVLIRACNFSFFSQFPGPFRVNLPLWPQNIELFAKPVHFLMINEKPVIFLQAAG